MDGIRREVTSASWVTHNGCDKKTHIRDTQKVPQLRES